MLLVPNGVDLAEVPEKPEPGSDPFTVFYVGGIATQNGASVLLQAFRRLSQTRSNARLVLAGEIVSSEQAHYERELQPGNGVAYLGPTPPDEVHRQMESAHVCVYPFLHTRATDCVYPVKVFEYLAMGRPVIASRLQGVSRIIRHEWNGLLVEPGDAGALAGALERIAADAELRASLARRARASVERFDWAAIHAAVGPRLDTALLGAAS
jgi:glycosyltransferase involved in cell wall biosynthesis